ncbi:MAG: fasciclin domain-containing protein, partial [Bacteroidota bacterium]|nr:fasciclin domain-containing protein [Bacteroidota bacterium]
MKNTCFRINLVKISSLKLIISLALLSLVGLSACNSDDIGGNLYTFTDETMGEYLRKHPDSYSEFTRLLDTTHVMSLLNTYGTYTCFAPDNKAMRAFYKLKGKSDLSDFSLDSLKQIAYDHIIMGTAVNSTSFVEGRLPELSMSDRYITVTMKNTGEIFINKTSQIIVKDIIVHNGIIHQIDEALNPVRDGVVEAISKDAHFNLFYQALEATGLADSLMLVQDDSYNAENYKDLATTTLDQNNWFYEVVPQKRKFGYTVLMESDSTMNASQGITDMESLKVYAASVYDKVYPEDANITNPKDRRNSLNRFIAYHLITKQLGYSTFIDAYDVAQMVKTRDMYEYVETMCPNTLIEVSKIRSLNETNLLNRDPETGAAVRIVKSNSDNDAINGVYHEVDKMLVYDQATHNMMSTKRLRFDSASFFDELTNNNMRDKGVTDPNLRFALPRGYVNRISCTEQTVVQYLTGYPKYE